MANACFANSAGKEMGRARTGSSYYFVRSTLARIGTDIRRIVFGIDHDARRLQSRRRALFAGVVSHHRVLAVGASVLLAVVTLAACSSDRPSAPTPVPTPSPTPVPPPPPAMPGSQWSGNGHFFLLLFCPGNPPSPCSWEEARRLAQNVGAGWDLATVTSAAENDFVRSLFANNTAACNVVRSTPPNSAPWIGASLVGPGRGQYAWVTVEPFSFTNWGPNEPFGNGDRISYADWTAPYCDGSGLAWNDIGSGRSDGPTAFIAESHAR